MIVDADSVVIFHYRLSDEREQAIEDSYQGDPIACLYGRGAIIPGLEKALRGRQKGETFRVAVLPIEGYGLRNESLKQRVPIKHLQVARRGTLRPGQIVAVETPSGPRQVTILKVGKFHVDVDGNHPFAGKNLHFQIEIVDVRGATQEELAHGHAHGTGGHPH